jgi:hypothetical protein
MFPLCPLSKPTNEDIPARSSTALPVVITSLVTKKFDTESDAVTAEPRATMIAM